MQFTKLKKKSYLTLFLNEKMQKNLAKNSLWKYRCIKSEFFSIALKFGPQVQNEF